MPIPRSRRELVELITSAWAKLDAELERAPAGVEDLSCVDGWSVKDLLVVRAWWTHSVVDWIEAGRDGATLDLPAEGYGWRETPRLNDDLVREAADQTYADVRARLRAGYDRVLATIEALDDTELLEPGVFPWAGKWPIARWISLNTARQYTTARTFIRRALREAGP